MKLLSLIFAGTVTLSACSSGGSGVSVEIGSQAQAIPDSTLGFSKRSIFGTPEPEPVIRDASFPGEGLPQPRMSLKAPPVIPHGIIDFGPITREYNPCLDCHIPGEKVEGMPTPVPASHLVDLRNSPGEVRDSVAGARHICTTCHVSRTLPPG